MKITLETIDRLTVQGTFDESDIEVQDMLVQQMSCRIVSFRSIPGGFEIVGERPYKEMSAEEYLELAMGEDAYADMMDID